MGLLLSSDKCAQMLCLKNFRIEKGKVQSRKNFATDFAGENVLSAAKANKKLKTCLVKFRCLRTLSCRIVGVESSESADAR